MEVDPRPDPVRAGEPSQDVPDRVLELGFEDILDEVLATTDVTTVMMPYASALFSRRIPADRPKVIPDGAQNFAFLGSRPLSSELGATAGPVGVLPSDGGLLALEAVHAARER